MKHIPRLMNKDEILDIEKRYSHYATIKDEDYQITQMYKNDLVDRIPHLIAHIKELQSIVGQLCPIGELDVITSLKAEKQFVVDSCIELFRELSDAIKYERIHTLPEVVRNIDHVISILIGEKQWKKENGL